jgi:RHS repeat-associated protein
VIAEYVNGAGVTTPTREYLYLGGQLLAKIESSTTTYYHHDHLSARVMSDTGGGIANQSGHFPFGEDWYETSANKLKFTSYARDSESGNDYAMFRTHISRFGRFSSPDPIAGSISNPQSLNRYSYVQNQPVNATDPLGLRMCLSMGTMGTCGASGTWRLQMDVSRSVFWPDEGDTSLSFNCIIFSNCFLVFDYGYGDDGSGGRQVREKQGKPIDPFRRLGECVKDLYKVEVRSFVPSARGSNGNFVGRDSKGNTFSVENDVASYTKVGLGWLDGKFGYPLAGLTLSSNPYVNYTASNLATNEAVTSTQIHELAHSLDVITSGRSSEASADRLLNCLWGSAKPK